MAEAKADRDTQVLHIKPGDEIRYMGEWFDVLSVEFTGRHVIVTVHADPARYPNGERQFIYEPHVFVAARRPPIVAMEEAIEQYSEALDRLEKAGD